MGWSLTAWPTRVESSLFLLMHMGGGFVLVGGGGRDFPMVPVEAGLFPRVSTPRRPVIGAY